MNKRVLTLPAVLLAGGLALAGCGDGSHDNSGSGSMPGMSSPAASSMPGVSMSPGASMPAGGSAGATASAAHNAADTTFAQQMIEHHRGAIAMAKLANARAGSAQVKTLATKIEAAQQPEINTMTSWLQAWGETVPADMSGMNHGGMAMGSASPMAGMMTDQQMSELTAAKGTAFDRMFLQMMTVHHRGAITMAQQERASGQNPDALTLAENIITDQTGEITVMQRMLKAL